MAGLSEALLEQAVRRLVAEFHPEQVYLFGSRARGDAHADSDYDFLVIVPDAAAADRGALGRVARQAVGGIGIAAETLVCTASAFQHARPLAASLAAAVEREGRLLYGPPLPPIEVLSPMEAADRRAALARTWTARAHEDRAAARLMAGAQPALLSGAVYHCQQAFEKVLKGFLAWHDQPLRKTHLLDELVEQCAGIEPDFKQLAEPARVVSPYAYRFRYPRLDTEGRLVVEPSEPSREETDRALTLTEQAVQLVLIHLPDAAQP